MSDTEDQADNFYRYIRAYQVAHGVVGAAAYASTVHIMAGLLVLGFICNLLVRPVDPKHHMTGEMPTNSPAH
jgi:hypothetical protein